MKKHAKKSTCCKYCGCCFDLGQLASSIKKVYDRLCPERDYDLCERV